MKKIILAIGIIFSGVFCHCQILQDRITGKYYFERKDPEFKGTPFFYEDWRPSLVTYTNGLQLKNVKLKFDQYTNMPLFQRNDSAFEFIDQVWEFVIYNSPADSVIFRNDFSGDELISSENYLEVLAEGKLTLLRHQAKNKTETRTFSSATVTTEFTLKPSILFLLVNNKLVRFKKNDETFLKPFLKNNWESVSDFMKLNKSGLKKDADIISIIRHYNTL